METISARQDGECDVACRWTHVLTVRLSQFVPVASDVMLAQHQLVTEM